MQRLQLAIEFVGDRFDMGMSEATSRRATLDTELNKEILKILKRNRIERLSFADLIGKLVGQTGIEPRRNKIVARSCLGSSAG